MLDCVANLLQAMVGENALVRAAHMELAEPLIPQGVEACVEAGATELVVFPYMLSPGKHSTRDIPRIVAEATRGHPGLRVQVTPAFGVHAKLAEVIAERSGVELASAIVALPHPFETLPCSWTAAVSVARTRRASVLAFELSLKAAEVSTMGISPQRPGSALAVKLRVKERRARSTMSASISPALSAAMTRDISLRASSGVRRSIIACVAS